MIIALLLLYAYYYCRYTEKHTFTTAYLDATSVPVYDTPSSGHRLPRPVSHPVFRSDTSLRVYYKHKADSTVKKENVVPR